MNSLLSESDVRTGVLVLLLISVQCKGNLNLLLLKQQCILLKRSKVFFRAAKTYSKKLDMTVEFRSSVVRAVHRVTIVIFLHFS